MTKNPSLSKVINLPDSAEVCIGDTADGLEINHQESQMKSSSNYDENYALRFYFY